MPKGGKKKGGKKVVASLPPSDEEYDTGDNWSTASVLSEDISSISEDGENGADDTTVVENFEDKLKDCIEGISQKSGKGRISCIETMAKLLSKKYVYDFLSYRKVTVSDGLLRCLKKGNGDEQAASAKCLSLLCVQLGNEIEDDFKEVHSLLLTILADNTAPVKARSECAATLAMSNFLACTDISVVDNTMLALENIFKGSYRKGDKSVPSHPQQISRLHADALSAWSLLISIAPTFSVEKKIEMHLSRLSDLLESSDVELRIVAGETIALLYELAREEDEEYEGEDICTLCATLKNLATDSHKYRAKKDRKMQRSSFRDVLRAVEEGDEPDLAVKFGKECVMIDSWSKREQYDSLCQALTSGVNHHLQENPVIREIFGLGPPIPVGNVPPQKVSKWERTHYNAALFKARTKARSKHRDKRSVVMNGGD
ncbi:Hypothetical predicted protein [Mytilus galloprovincialis]|uniref:Interferon-related developmental regulator 1 n=1 Tax=Mytilus galloprovincialis TaxID=29158 RepID=A0A8B6FJ27_MYTGA|nr:Hypothetical predicted protein [Mytilus galloprovincialis]